MTQIETQCFAKPWKLKDFRNVLSKHGCTGLVYSADDQIVGYIIYSNGQKAFKIINIAVSPYYHRKKIGSQLLTYMKSMLKLGGIEQLVITVPDTNLSGHMFLFNNEFIAIDIVKEFLNSDTDGYVFSYRLHPENEEEPLKLEEEEITG